MTSRALFAFFFVLITSVITNFYINADDKTKSSTPSSEQTKDPSHDLNYPAFDSIVNRIKEDYVEPVDDDKLLAGALNGMLSSLDPHSAYLDADTYEKLKSETKGEFGGLGMEVTMENGLVKIISPIDDTPAQKEGLEAGDLIVAIDKKPISGMTLLEAVDLLRGKPGTTVQLHIKRKGKDVFEKKLTRAIIHVKPIKWHAEGNIGYIRISTFNEETLAQLKEAVASLKKQLGAKLEGLVLDVRNNPGGLLDVAISTTNLFLTKGQEIVSTRGRTAKTDVRAYADASDIAAGLPIVVLINGGSASASEILAGALQDNKRAVVVGTDSFGKGSVQVLMPLTNGGAIKLTIARYYTPSGRSIQAKGIVPDILIEQVKNKLEKVDENENIHEEDFVGALDTDKNKKQKSADNSQPGGQKTSSTDEELDPTKQKKKEVEDYQLMRAIDIVRTMAITKNYDKQATGTN